MRKVGRNAQHRKVNLELRQPVAPFVNLLVGTWTKGFKKYAIGIERAYDPTGIAEIHVADWDTAVEALEDHLESVVRMIEFAKAKRDENV